MEAKLRILHLEDDSRDAELVEEMLTMEGIACQVVRVDSRADFLDALDRSRFDLIFADYSLPSFDGISALQITKEKSPDIPFIFISGRMGEDLAIESLNLGATDYILKDRLSRLVPAVKRALRERKEKRERKRSREVLEFSHLLLQIVNRHTALTPLLQEVARGIQNFTGCAAVGIRLIDERGAIPYRAGVGFPEEFYRLESSLSLQSDLCLCINVLTETTDPGLPFYTRGGSFFTNGISGFWEKAEREYNVKTLSNCSRLGYESVALVPIRTGEDVIGALHVIDSRKGLMELCKVEVLEDVALQLGMAIQHIKVGERLRESEQKLRRLSAQLLTVQETERKRIAGELHDGVASSLVAIKFSIEKILHREEQQEGVREELGSLVSNAQLAIDETRRIMTDLRPSMLDELGIILSINWLCREFEHTYSDVSIEKLVEAEEVRIPDSLRTPIFRICQEALTNIAKHSDATLVHLGLQERNDRIELTIQDNGKGFDSHTVQGGLGLCTMAERAEFSGGVCLIASQEGAGTTVQCSWPRLLRGSEPSI